MVATDLGTNKKIDPSFLGNGQGKVGYAFFMEFFTKRHNERDGTLRKGKKGGGAGQGLSIKIARKEQYYWLSRMRGKIKDSYGVDIQAGS